MTNKRNRNKAKTGQSPPTPAPAKKKIDRTPSPSPSGSVCPQEDCYLIACINCNQTFIYTLTSEPDNTNHCFGQIFAHKDSKSFTCNLNCSFNKPTEFCPYSTPKLTVNTSMEMMDTKSISSDNTISSQAISPTSTTQSPFHNVTSNVTPNVAHAAPNVALNLNTNTDDLITNVNTNTNEQDSSDIDIIMVNQDQQTKKTYAETITPKNKNRSTNKPDLPLFSSIIPHNESLPYTFPNNNQYFHSFYNYVLPGIRAFKPGFTTFDKTIDILSNNLPNKLITEWKNDIDINLFTLQSAKRKFVTKNLCNLLDYIFTKLDYVKFFATKIPPSPHNDRLNVFRNCA